MSKKTIRKIAVGLLLIPLGFLTIFTVGEMFSGDISGLSHLIQMLPLVLIIVLIYKKPLLGGILLASISLFLGISYAFLENEILLTKLLVEGLLFVPGFISGVLLIVFLRKK